ncbi:hypothetical protein ANO14919_061320 [Xylariales sp. No.14919]|nr:hypothetical protein ANO14919_061320 [Xylariales sp. No.14919]
MLVQLLAYGLVFSAVAWFLSPIVEYIRDKKGLRQFPSPPVAAHSALWRMYHNLRWKHYAAVHDAHKRLGAHVRIAPNHVSILTPEAPNEIYGHGANMLKEAWYDAGAAPHRNLADTRIKAEHTTKRKMLAHAFAAKTVTGFEPMVQETLTAFKRQMDSHADAGAKVDLRLYLNYFTIDLVGNILYGHKLGCLDRGDDQLEAEDKSSGKIYKSGFIQPLLDATVITNLLAFAPQYLPITKPLFSYHPYKKSGADWENIVYHNTKKRLANELHDEDRLFGKLLRDSKGNEINLPMGELLAECSAIMNAGTETTTAAMTATVFLLYTHPKILAKLREEVESAAPGNAVITNEIASKLPYLRACIEEALRVRPASTFGLPRIVPEGGRVIAGKFIQGGVTVSVPTYSLLRDESVFKNAEEYNPDRWMTKDPDLKRRMNNNHIPFSTGPRACIGRNIAYFELTMMISTLVKHYDVIIPEGFDLEVQERFNANPGNLVVDIKKRAVHV